MIILQIALIVAALLLLKTTESKVVAILSITLCLVFAKHMLAQHTSKKELSKKEFLLHLQATKATATTWGRPKT
jgi:hypothetical protein